jgi:3-deoxy-D-manno-octulosonic-acid transferase
MNDGRRRQWRARGALVALAYGVAAPLALAALAGRLWLRRRALVGLDAKLLGRGPPARPGAVVLHGVSLGEVTLMRGLVPALEAAGARCLLTTSTETGWAGLGKHFPQQARTFLPFDLPWAVRRFLTRYRPRLVVLLENELWPILLCACAERGIPVALVNARMTERSHRRLRLGGALLRPLLRSLTLVLAQNPGYGARLLQLGVARPRLRVLGSLKADVVAPAPAEAAAAEGRRLGLDAGRPILLVASTSDPEERPLLAAAAPLLAQGWRLVLCPRHPERGGELAAACAAHGWTAVRSAAGAPADAETVLIVDEIGRLGALYALAAASGGIAVVGGSLGSGRGGQNMLEAAAAGCCTVVGPDTRNQPEAMQLLRHAGAVLETTPAALAGDLAALAAAPGRRATLGAAAQGAWAGARGAGRRTSAALATLLDAAAGGR